jgi:phospholipase/carboxylesterase
MAELHGPRFGPHSGGAPEQLVVICHGVGAYGRDLMELAPRCAEALPDALFVLPDAPEPHDAAPYGRQWFSLRDRSPPVLEAGMRAAMPVFNRFLDAELARLGLPADAYALIGFSQGAMVALFAGLRRRVPPRAILAYSGGLLAPESLGHEISGRPPVLLIHGEADDVVPAARSRAAEQALRAAGVPVEALYIPGLGHGIDDAGLAAGARFLRSAFGEA